MAETTDDPSAPGNPPSDAGPMSLLKRVPSATMAVSSGTPVVLPFVIAASKALMTNG